MQILRALGFRIGAPTIKEFIDRILVELEKIMTVTDQLKKLCNYLAKLACHSYKLM